jgi:hypothetical protein
MKRLLVGPLLLVLAAASPAPVSVVAATGDWSNLPPIGQTDTQHQSKNLILALDRIASSHECALPGYNGRRFNFNVTFAAQFNADGTLNQLVVPKLDCPKAEAALGGALKEMIEGGDYRPTGQSPQGWYKGQFSFDIDEASD